MMTDAVLLRHELHKIPELMFQEFRTTALLLSAVQALPGLTIHRPLETGLIAEYKINDGGYLLFRADIDALPIKEMTEAGFASTNDNMHACGHDVHSAILFGFAKWVTENKPQQNILFLFQPGEEGGGGASKILASGVLQNFRIQNAFALHVTDDYDFGSIASTKGILFAAATEIDVDISGKSSHIAFPERGIDAYKHLTRFLTAADTVIERTEKPVLFGYGKVVSGTARNIIPSHARAECTLRTLTEEKLHSVVSEFERILISIKQESGIGYEIKTSLPYTEVFVDEKLYDLLLPSLSNEFTFTDCGHRMTAEDFGLFSKRYPSFMCWLGTGRGERHGLHTPFFLPPDDIIEKGVTLNKTILAALMKRQ